MLKGCVLDFGDSWDKHLPLLKFTYSNNYHSSIGIAPCEALYGRPCQSLTYWNKVRNICVLGTYLIQEAIEKIAIIYKNLTTA